MDTINPLQFILSFFFVVGLIGLFAFMLKYVSAKGLLRATSMGKRLHIIESISIDPKRRLLLIKRDTTEHLLLLGMQGEILLESFEAIAALPMPQPPIGTAQ